MAVQPVHIPNARAYARLCEIAANEGITAPVIGMTAFPGLSDRLEAIRAWIVGNGPVEAWCALDDETMADDRCIKVNFEFGVSTQNYSNAARLLGRTIEHRIIQLSWVAASCKFDFRFFGVRAARENGARHGGGTAP